MLICEILRIILIHLKFSNKIFIKKIRNPFLNTCNLQSLKILLRIALKIEKNKMNFMKNKWGLKIRSKIFNKLTNNNNSKKLLTKNQILWLNKNLQMIWFLKTSIIHSIRQPWKEEIKRQTNNSFWEIHIYFLESTLIILWRIVENFKITIWLNSTHFIWKKISINKM